MSSLKYRPEIDGLRTLAVVPVILFHLGLSWIDGGFLGVDVFFVISGFLISSIILKDMDAGTFSFKDFWVRRIRRIVPVLTTMLIVTMIAASFLIFPGALKDMAKDAIAALFSYFNFHALFSFGSYWNVQAETSLFLHTWSLSVEEQFYLVYPIFLYLLKKLRISIPLGIITLFIVSLGLYIYGVITPGTGMFTHDSVIFYMLPFRAWEMSLGGIIALAHNPTRTSKNNGIIPTAISVCAILLILIGYLIPGQKNISLIAILPVVGAALFILFSSQSKGIGKLLAMRPMVYIGKLSYSLYLWHWPITVILKQYYFLKYSDLLINWMIVILTIVLSMLSYYLVENRVRFHKKAVLIAGSGATMVIAISLFFLYFTPKVSFSFNTVDAYFKTYSLTPEVKNASSKITPGVINHPRQNEKSNAFKEGGLIFGNPQLKYPEIAVFGNSYAQALSEMLREVSDSLDSKICFWTNSGELPPLTGQDAPTNDTEFSSTEFHAYAEMIHAQFSGSNPPKVLIISCMISKYRLDQIEEIIELAKTSKVILVNQPPILDKIGDKYAIQALSFAGYAPNGEKQYFPATNEQRTQKGNLELQNIAREYQNVELFDLYSIFKDDQKGVWVIDGKDVLYKDDNHLSHQGALRIQDAFYHKIKKILDEDKSDLN